MKQGRKLAWLGCAVLPFALPLLGAPQATVSDPNWSKTFVPFINKYCVSCHSGPTPPGDIRLESYRQPEVALAQRDVFDLVAVMIKGEHMPPDGAPQPTQAERNAAVLAIQKLFAKAPPPPIDPGRVTMRRLNRAEYDNTIRDLLKIDFKPSADFPTDDVGYGFDNIGDVLSLSPLLFEKYLDASEKAAAMAIVLPTVRTVQFHAGQMETDRGNLARGNSLGLFSLGYGGVDFRAPKGGQYRLRVRAWAQQAGPEPAKLSLRLAEKEIQVFDVQGREGAPDTFEVPVDLAQGSNKIAGFFVNDYYQPQHPDPNLRGDRNLFLVSFEFHGPLAAEPDKPLSHRELMTATFDPKDPLDAARTNLRPFLKRAFRRTVSDSEVERYAKLVPAALKEGEAFEQGMRTAVAAALVSPHFLFRVELDARPSPTGKTRPLNDYEIASRLSYFLWSSMPDAELFRLADAGKLKDAATLRTQALRMLRDPKSRALTDNFATQWLTLRKLENASPDPGLFPNFDEALKKDMEEESKAYFSDVMKSDRSVIEFLDSSHAFLNERMAKHYGIAGVGGPNFRKVQLKGKQRGGLLTMASVLTVTSNPNRTSPVKRGKWLLENILGAPPPPPPPGLDGLEEGESKTPSKTIKERMERHRRDPSCAVCHAKMDPLGLAFENYDAVGRWRTMDGKFPVDATGTMSTGEKFSGAADIKKVLLGRKGEFVRTLTEKLMTFALGRGLDRSDRRAMDAIVAGAEKEGYRFSSLVKGIVSSEAFRRRRIE